MIWPWLVTWISLFCVLLGVGVSRRHPRYDAVAKPLAGAAAVCASIFLIVALIISGERHFGRVACRTFAQQSGRVTKFVIYTSASGGDCLTPDGKGHWIPTKNLREFGSKP